MRTTVVYAHNLDATHHAAARAQWERAFHSGTDVGLAWANPLKA